MELQAKRQGSEKASVLLTLSALQEATKVANGYKRVLALGSMTCLHLIIKDPAEAQTQGMSMHMALNLLLTHRKTAL